MKRIKKIILRIKTYYELKFQLRTLERTFTSIMDRPDGDKDDRLKDRTLLMLMDEMGEIQDKIDNL